MLKQAELRFAGRMTCPAANFAKCSLLFNNGAYGRFTSYSSKSTTSPAPHDELLQKAPIDYPRAPARGFEWSREAAAAGSRGRKPMESCALELSRVGGDSNLSRRSMPRKPRHTRSNPYPEVPLRSAARRYGQPMIRPRNEICGLGNRSVTAALEA